MAASFPARVARVALFAVAAAACADASTTTGVDPSSTDTSTFVPDTCRNYATSIVALQQQSTASVSFTYRYTYDRAANRLTIGFVAPALTSTTVYQYDSVGAFIDETSVIPNRARARSGTSTGVNTSGTSTSSVLAYEYDGQNRLTRYTSNTTATTAGNSTTSTAVLTSTAWDSAGRPTAVTVESTTSGAASVQHQTIVHDARTRTSTTTVTGGLSEVITAIFDVNGNPVRNVYAYSGAGAPPPTTVSYTTLATERICR